MAPPTRCTEACCWRRFRITLDGLRVYLLKTDDERRGDRTSRLLAE
jgi:hypothetical protein